jgi:hypothetical protein
VEDEKRGTWGGWGMRRGKSEERVKDGRRGGKV